MTYPLRSNEERRKPTLVALDMNLPKILIVDDRLHDRMLYQEFLGDVNYIIAELDDGETIIETVDDFRPDIILLDWQMPRVGGLESLKRIKKHKIFKEIPVIIITGLQNDSVLEEAFDYGSVDFINKPVSKIQLNSRVDNALKLFESKKLLFKQREELKTLNDIITYQKEELEKSLELKSQMYDSNIRTIEEDLNKKNKKAISMEIDSSKIINTVHSLKSSLDECYSMLKSENSESAVLRNLKTTIRNIDALDIQDDSLDDFKEAFENIDQEFYQKLFKINPKLTTLDQKHCGYIKLNLDNYEISRILNVELKSLQMSRYRLKKKLNIPNDITLRTFISSL